MTIKVQCFAGASKLRNTNIGLAFAQVCHSTIKCHSFFFTSVLSTGYENLAKIEIAKHVNNWLNKIFELSVYYLIFFYIFVTTELRLLSQNEITAKSKLAQRDVNNKKC